MYKLKDYKEKFKNNRADEWDQIPNIDLYMDQVISYMERQHLGLTINENITSSMVNNYVKQKVLPKAKGKKYTKEHIAYITAICLLKQVLSVNETKDLIDMEVSIDGIEKFYGKFLEILDKELIKMDTLIGENNNKTDLADIALNLAVSSYASKLACECILDSLADDNDDK